MNSKEAVGIKAAAYVEDGMTVGLGTGSTVYYFILELGRRVKEEGLQLVGVSTSDATTTLAEQLGIPVKMIDEVEKIDLTIDGADEISADFCGIKGGGAALLREKIVAMQSDRIIWIVDSSKMVEKLGKFPLPVEVIPYGYSHLLRLFREKGYEPHLRNVEGDPILTDNGNYIIDLALGRIDDPRALADELDHITGVVEHGLFNNLVDLVLVGDGDDVLVVEAD